MRSIARVTITLVAALTIGATAALAQANAPVQAPPDAGQPPPPPPPPPGWYRPADPTAHRHLGFFIRPDIGLGYAESSASSGSNSVKLSGGAGTFGVSIGGAVKENLILAGHLYGIGMRNPDVTVNGASQNTTDTDFTLVGIGPELDYYFMPQNVYVSLTLAITKQSVSEGGVSSDTDTGFGLELGAGKEWWVSDHWGLGVAGKFTFSTNKDSGSGSPTWNAWGLAAVFSATYN